MERTFFRLIIHQMLRFVSDTQKPKWMRTLVLIFLYLVYAGFLVWFAGYIYSERRFLDGGLTFLVTLIFTGIFVVLFSMTKRFIQANTQISTSQEADTLMTEIVEETDTKD